MKETEIYERAHELAERFANVVMSGEEIENDEELMEFLSDPTRFDLFQERLKHAHEIQKRFREILAEDKDQKTNALINRINHHERVRRRKLIAITGSVAAALVCVSFLLWNSGDKSSHKSIAQKDQVIVPTLILNNGQKIPLNDSIQNEVLLAENDSLKPHMQYNTLVVPHGYTYTHTLSDGSKVTVNAGSELTYPVCFSDTERNVKVKGEAYFEVAKSSKPFIVHAGEIKVKVYGTKFNVNAKDSLMIKTVLVSGSVGVRFKDQKEVMIEPNEMLIADVLNKIFEIEDVDCTMYTSWMNGLFQYQNEPLKTVLEDFASWYGIQFTFTESYDKEVVVTGSFFKTTQLEEIIETLESITNIKFEKKENEYIVR